MVLVGDTVKKFEEPKLLAEMIKWVLISITFDGVNQLPLVSVIRIKIFLCKDYIFEKPPIVRPQTSMGKKPEN